MVVFIFIVLQPIECQTLHQQIEVISCFMFIFSLIHRLYLEMDKAPLPFVQKQGQINL